MRMELHTLFSQFVQTMEKKNMSSKLKMVSFIILKNFKNANINAILAKTTMLRLTSKCIFSDDDVWEYVDLDSNSQIGEMVEYKTSVLFHGEWDDSKWNKG